jgi:hypothetical protein
VIPSPGLSSDVIILSDSRRMRFYDDVVMELVERSVTDFSRQIGGNRPQSSGQILPDIWVGGKKLYQYQTLDDGVGQMYKLTGCCKVVDEPRYLSGTTEECGPGLEGLYLHQYTSAGSGWSA